MVQRHSAVSSMKVPPALEFGRYTDSILAQAEKAGIPERITDKARENAATALSGLYLLPGRVIAPRAGPRKKEFTVSLSYEILRERGLYPRPLPRPRREKIIDSLLRRKLEVEVKPMGRNGYAVTCPDSQIIVSFGSEENITSLAACRGMAVDYVKLSDDGKHGIAVELRDLAKKKFHEPIVEIHVKGSEGFERVLTRAMAGYQEIAKPALTHEFVKRGAERN